MATSVDFRSINIPDNVLYNPGIWRKNLTLERGFVNDGVRTEKYHYSRKLPIIPSYKALRDRENSESKKTENNLKAGKGEENRVHSPETPFPKILPELERREDMFINDAVFTEKQRTRYRDTLLPTYDALSDPSCQDYFGRKDVKKLIDVTYSDRPALALAFRTEPHYGMLPSAAQKNMTLARENRTTTKQAAKSSAERNYSVQRTEKRQTTPAVKSSSFKPSPSKQNTAVTSHKSLESTSSSSKTRSTGVSGGKLATSGLSYADINSLSFRHIAKPSLSQQQSRSREDSFINDAIITERRRTRWRDIIPRYDASGDKYCSSYFRRPDVKRLIAVTCTLKPVRRFCFELQ